MEAIGPSLGVMRRQHFASSGPGLSARNGQKWIKTSQKYLKFSDQAIWLSLSVG
jgi:hypothetical protein